MSAIELNSTKKKQVKRIIYSYCCCCCCWLVAAAISGQCLSITIFAHFLFNLYTNLCVFVLHTHTHKRLTNPRICCLFAWQLMKLFMILSPSAPHFPLHILPLDYCSVVVVIVQIYIQQIYTKKMYMHVYFIEQVNGRQQNMLYVWASLTFIRLFDSL